MKLLRIQLVPFELFAKKPSGYLSKIKNTMYQKEFRLEEYSQIHFRSMGECYWLFPK